MLLGPFGRPSASDDARSRGLIVTDQFFSQLSALLDLVILLESRPRFRAFHRTSHYIPPKRKPSKNSTRRSAAMWFPTLLGAAALLATTVLADEPAMDVSYDVKEDLLPLEVALGLDTGVGVRCAEGQPRGEDLVEYCRPLTPQERLRLNRTATSEYSGRPSLCLSGASPSLSILFFPPVR